MFRQCELKKRKPGKIEWQTAWIPEQFAKLGTLVKLMDDDGWEVVSVGKGRMDDDKVSEQSQEYKHQRKMSDI